MERNNRCRSDVLIPIREALAGSQVITSPMTTEVFANAQQLKERLWIKGASHVNLYDKEKYVAPAI
ncbi:MULTISPECIES: hypothetical protein [unclassified Paenibacillus]|uniref:hypothetical protein n=1 Tax=unclassified Paenibacillus TaxID=185978 RepID=UPI0036D32138